MNIPFHSHLVSESVVWYLSSRKYVTWLCDSFLEDSTVFFSVRNYRSEATRSPLEYLNNTKLILMCESYIINTEKKDESLLWKKKKSQAKAKNNHWQLCTAVQRVARDLQGGKAVKTEHKKPGRMFKLNSEIQHLRSKAFTLNFASRVCVNVCLCMFVWMWAGLWVHVIERF